MPQADSELQSLLSQRSHGSLHLLGDLRYWRPCLGMLPQQFNVRCGVGLACGSLVRFGHFLLLGCLHIMRGQAIKRIVGTTSRFAGSANNSRNRSFPMRQQRTQRMSTPSPISPTPISRAGVGLPTSGYALIVDGRAKKEFDTQDRALKAARELKGRFPNLQVKVFNAEKRQSETIELAVA